MFISLFIMKLSNILSDALKNHFLSLSLPFQYIIEWDLIKDKYLVCLRVTLDKDKHDRPTKRLVKEEKGQA